MFPVDEYIRGQIYANNGITLIRQIENLIINTGRKVEMEFKVKIPYKLNSNKSEIPMSVRIESSTDEKCMY